MEKQIKAAKKAQAKSMARRQYLHAAPSLHPLLRR